MTVDNRYHSHKNDKYKDNIIYDNVDNINTYIHTTEKTTTGGIPESTYQGPPFSRSPFARNTTCKG